MAGTGGAGSGFWNGMVVPLLNMTVKGVVWYQGEAEATAGQHAAGAYSCAFPALVNDWRAKWSASSATDGSFPFGVVQLSVWGDHDNSTCADAPCPAAVVRHAQTADYGYAPNEKLQEVFMATAIDLGDPHSPRGDIRPRNKRTVADRLYAAADALVYGNQTVYHTGIWMSNATWCDVSGEPTPPCKD